MAYYSQLPQANLNWVDIRDTLGLGAETDGRQMMISPNVNPWGFNPPDAAQFDRYFGKETRFQPHDMGAFRRYEHRWRAYTFDNISRHFTPPYGGITITTKAANPTISDDIAVADSVIRVSFEYQTPSGTWANGGSTTRSINKVGSGSVNPGSLGALQSTRVRVRLSADTPLADRIFDPRKIPTTTVIGDGTSSPEYTGYFFGIVGMPYDQTYWEYDYNFFPDQLFMSPPSGCYQDAYNFWDIQAKNFARWISGDTEIELYGLRTINKSPYAETARFLLEVADNANFTNAETFYPDRATPVDRGWYEAGTTTLHGSDTAPLIYSGVPKYGTTFCRIKIALLQGKTIDYEDNNLFGIKFIMV